MPALLVGEGLRPAMSVGEGAPDAPLLPPV